MARPSLFPSRLSTPSSLPEALHQACSGAARADEFARWVAGERSSPSTLPEGRSSALPEPSKPRVIEVTPDAAAGEVKGWLGQELRRRGSVAPDSLAPQVLPPEPALEARESEPPAELPQTPVHAVESTSAGDLDADDFAVLPGRARRGRRSRRGGFVALALLVLFAGVFALRSRSGSESAASIAEPEEAPAAAAAQLPPPPEPAPVVEVEPEPEPEVGEPASAAPPAAKRARAERESDAENENFAEPASELEAALRRGGPSVRRFADLPLPTLSKLAREEDERLKQRDAAVRSKKTARN